MIFRLAEPHTSQPPAAQPAPPNGRGPGHDERATAGEEVNYILMVITPWVISLLLHLGIVVIAFFVLWTAGPEEDDEGPIVPIANLSETPGTPLEVTPEQEIEEQTQERQISQPQQQSQLSSISAQASDASDQLSGGGATGAGDSPFQTATSTTLQSQSEIYGVQDGNAQKIVYVIDASGSIIAEFNFIIDELIRSIQKLDKRQEFTIIFYKSQDVIEVPSPNRGYKRATSRNKQSVIDWLDPTRDNITPAGRSNPIPALQLALQYNPDLIFLLSDEITGQGAYAVDQLRLLREIERVNDGNTKISTIQFINRDPLEALGLTGTMERIAQQTGGEYTFVDAEEAGRMSRNSQ